MHAGSGLQGAFVAKKPFCCCLVDAYKRSIQSCCKRASCVLRISLLFFGIIKSPRRMQSWARRRTFLSRRQAWFSCVVRCVPHVFGPGETLGAEMSSLYCLPNVRYLTTPKDGELVLYNDGDGELWQGTVCKRGKAFKVLFASCERSWKAGSPFVAPKVPTTYADKPKQKGCLPAMVPGEGNMLRGISGGDVFDGSTVTDAQAAAAAEWVPRSLGGTLGEKAAEEEEEEEEEKGAAASSEEDEEAAPPPPPHPAPKAAAPAPAPAPAAAAGGKRRRRRRVAAASRDCARRPRRGRHANSGHGQVAHRRVVQRLGRL